MKKVERNKNILLNYDFKRKIFLLNKQEIMKEKRQEFIEAAKELAYQRILIRQWITHLKKNKILKFIFMKYQKNK